MDVVEGIPQVWYPPCEGDDAEHIKQLLTRVDRCPCTLPAHAAPPRHVTTALEQWLSPSATSRRVDQGWVQTQQ